MTEPTAIFSFTCYELWTKQHIIIAAGRGGKLIWPFHRLESYKRSTIWRNKTFLEELTVVLPVKGAKPEVMNKVLSVPVKEASISPSHCHFLHHCYVWLSVNIQETHLICRVNMSKICIDLVMITITILITKPTSTNWWSCPNHSVVLPSTKTHHLLATNTPGCSLHTLIRVA
jgi:hypothetical protein